MEGNEITENIQAENTQVENTEQNVEKKVFKFIDWVVWVFSALIIFSGAIYISESLIAGAFWILVGGSMFVKQLMKFKGKGEDNPTTQKANKVLKILKYFIYALVLLTVGSFVLGVILTFMKS